MSNTTKYAIYEKTRAGVFDGWITTEGSNRGLFFADPFITKDVVYFDTRDEAEEWLEHYQTTFEKNSIAHNRFGRWRIEEVDASILFKVKLTGRPDLQSYKEKSNRRNGK